MKVTTNTKKVISDTEVDLIIKKLTQEKFKINDALYLKDIPGWDATAVGEPRLAKLNQIRYLSSLALLAWVSNTDSPSAEVQAALIDTLDDENGYPPLIACLALERLGSVDAMRPVIGYLRARCWDSAQNTRPALSGAWTKAQRKATLARLTAST